MSPLNVRSPRPGDNRTIVFVATDNVNDVEDAFIDLGFKDVEGYLDSMEQWEDDGGNIEFPRFIQFEVINE